MNIETGDVLLFNLAILMSFLNHFILNKIKIKSNSFEYSFFPLIFTTIFAPPFIYMNKHKMHHFTSGFHNNYILLLMFVSFATKFCMSFIHSRILYNGNYFLSSLVLKLSEICILIILNLNKLYFSQ